MIQTHPFTPIANQQSKALIVGTLPPDTAPFYYSNSCNTRMWDILKTIQTGEKEIFKNTVLHPKEDKIEILNNLNVGMCDIIKKYQRSKLTVKDTDILPIEYFNVHSLAKEYNISNILFVYESAAKWFLHSLKKQKPIAYNALPKNKIDYGEFEKIEDVSCILLPNPLNRGKKGETLAFKLSEYKKYI